LIVVENTLANLVPAVFVDIDANEDGIGSLVSFNFSVSNGTVSINNGAFARSQTVTLTLTQLQSAQLWYRPDTLYSGTDSITLFFSDLSHSGLGGALVASAIISVIVTPVNNYPFVRAVPPVVTTVDEVSSFYPFVANDTSVSSILSSGSYFDEDSKSAPSGIAVSNADSNNGVWLFRCDGAWQPMSPSEEFAIVLNNTCSLRFLPNNLFFGFANLTYFGWDLDDGAAPGSAINITIRSVNGAYSAVSSQFLYRVVQVNQPPVFSVPASLSFLEDANETFAVSFVDIDADDSNGVLTLGVSVTNGTVSMFGESPRAVLNYSASQSVLNSGLANLRYIASANQFGQTALYLSLTDNGATGKGGPRVVSASIPISIAYVNDPPFVVSGAQLRLDSVFENQSPNVTLGTTVDSIIHGKAVDIDAWQPLGIAIVSANSVNGSWEYSTGGSWTPLPTLSLAQSLVLDGSSRLRFLSNLNYYGPAGLTCRIWDGTDSVPSGSRVDVSSIPSNGSYSLIVYPIAIDVIYVNQLPVIDLDTTTAGSGYRTTFYEATSDVPVVRVDSVSFTDVEGTVAQMLTIELSGIRDWLSESLLVNRTVSGTLTTRFESTIGSHKIIVTGLGGGLRPISEFIDFISAVRYMNFADQITAGLRFVSVVLFDYQNASLTSTSVIETVFVNHHAPILSLASTSEAFSQLGSPLSVFNCSSRSSLTDRDHNDVFFMSGARFSFSPLDGASELLAVVAAPRFSVSSGPGSLNVSGNGTLAEYFGIVCSLTYQNIRSLPTLGSRTVSAIVADEAFSSQPQYATLSISPRNLNAPVFVLDPPSTYVEHAILSLGGPNCSLTDVDIGGFNMVSATVLMASCPNSPFEMLTVVNPSGLSVAYWPQNCSLFLTGPAPVSTFSTALCSVRYNNSANEPSPPFPRLVSFRVFDGAFESAVVSASLQFNLVNDAPFITMGTVSSHVVAALEDGTPVIALPSSLSLTDYDNTSLSFAQVALLSRPDGAGELLEVDSRIVSSPTSTAVSFSFANQSISHLVAAQLVNATVSTFARIFGIGEDRILQPSLDVPTMTFSATLSTSSWFAVALQHVISRLGTSVFLPTAGVFVINPDSFVANIENISWSSASTNIRSSYSNGILTLSGPDTLSNFALALKSVTYTNLVAFSAKPNGGLRNVSTIVNDGLVSSSPVASWVSFSTVNNPPLIDLTGSAAGLDSVALFSENQPYAIVSPSAAIVDIDSANLVSFTARIVNNNDGPFESLMLTNGQPFVYDSFTATLTVTSVATVSVFQALLRSLAFANNATEPNTSPRYIEVFVSDGAATSLRRVARVNIGLVNDAPVLYSPYSFWT